MQKNLLALLLGFFLAFLCLATLELFFRANRNFHFIPKPRAWGNINYISPSTLDLAASKAIYDKLKSAPVFRWQEPYPFEQMQFMYPSGLDESQKGDLNCCMGLNEIDVNKDFHSKLYFKKPHLLIYDAHFTIDTYGRRLTPKSKDPGYNLLFFGGSYTLGEGVDNEENFPYLLGLKRPRAQVYNLGLSGGGLNDILYEAEEKDPIRLRDINPRLKTIVVYTFIDDHLNRFLCPSLCLIKINDYMLYKAYYAKSENHAVVFKGFFNTDRKYLNTLYSLFNASAIVQFFDLNWPPFFSNADIDYFTDGILGVKKRLQKRFPDLELYVAAYPSQEYGSAVLASAQSKGIHTLDYSRLNFVRLLNDRWELGDHHPSKIAHYIYSYLLDQDLPEPTKTTK